MDWDRVSREEKYERSQRSHEAFLAGTMPTATQGPATSESARPWRQPRSLSVDSLRRQAQPVTSKTWKVLELALESERRRVAHDRSVILFGRGAYKVVVFGVHGQDLFVEFPVDDYARMAALARGRGYRLRVRPNDEGWWRIFPVTAAVGAAHAVWICREIMRVPYPRQLRFCTQIFSNR